MEQTEKYKEAVEKVTNMTLEQQITMVNLRLDKAWQHARRKENRNKLDNLRNMLLKNLPYEAVPCHIPYDDDTPFENLINDMAWAVEGLNRIRQTSPHDKTYGIYNNLAIIYLY